LTQQRIRGEWELNLDHAVVITRGRKNGSLTRLDLADKYLSIRTRVHLKAAVLVLFRDFFKG